MLFHSKDLIGSAVHASDGTIGDVKEIYLDRRQWTVRYLAVETGSWLRRRQVLVPAASFPAQDFSSRELAVNLTKEQVMNSPDIDFNLPISRSREVELARHYQVPGAWREVTQGPGAVYIPEEGKSVAASGERISVLDEQSGSVLEAAEIPDADYLYSLSELRGYSVHAHDGKVGELDALLIDSDTLAARYAVVDTAQWLPGKKVLLSPRWVEDMNDEKSEIHVNLTRDVIRNSPPYAPSRPVTSGYEDNLREYYARDTSVSPYARWSFNNKRQAMTAGRQLFIELNAPATVRWTGDNWRTSQDVATRESGGRHIIELPTGSVPAGQSVHFTFYWPQAGRWENQNFSVKVLQPAVRRERKPEMAGV